MTIGLWVKIKKFFDKIKFPSWKKVLSSRVKSSSPWSWCDMLNPSYRSNQRPFFDQICLQKLRANTSVSWCKKWKNPTEGLKFFFSFLATHALKSTFIDESSLAKLQVGHSYTKGQIWSYNYRSSGKDKKVFCLNKISLMKKSPLVKGKNQVHHEVDVTCSIQAIGQTRDLFLIKYVFRS